MVVQFIVFLTLSTLICRGTDISKCFSESLGIRDNEIRLYLKKNILCTVLSRSQLCLNYFLTLPIWVYAIRKTFTPRGKKFFSYFLWHRPLFRQGFAYRKVKRNHKSYLSWQKWRKIYQAGIILFISRCCHICPMNRGKYKTHSLVLLANETHPVFSVPGQSRKKKKKKKKDPLSVTAILNIEPFFHFKDNNITYHYLLSFSPTHTRTFLQSLSKC